MPPGERHVCLICLTRFSSLKKPSNYTPRLLVNPTVSSCNNHGDRKSFEEDEDVPNLEDESVKMTPDLYSRFLLFVNRFLQLRTTADRFLSLWREVGKDKHGEETGAAEAFCEGCCQLVGYICDLFKELQTVKLYLIWKLGEMGERMRGSTRKVSQKLVRGLMMSVSKQLNLKSVRRVELFRRALQIKCTKIDRDIVPLLSIPRGLFPDEWKFTYSATKQALVQLIVVFLLASPDSKSKPEDDHDHDHLFVPADNKLKKRKKKNENEAKRCIRRPKKRETVTCGPKKDSGNDLMTFLNSEDGIKKEEPVTVDKNVMFEDDEDDSNHPLDNFGNDSTDSDWSHGRASPIDYNSANSEAEVSDANNKVFRRRTRMSINRKTDDANDKNTKSGRALAVEFENNESRDNSDQDKTKQQNVRCKSTQKSSKKADLKCSQCPRKFIDARGLAKHLRATHRTFNHYVCDKCGMRFKLTADLKAHHRDIHQVRGKLQDGKRPGRPVGQSGIPTKCPVCTEVFPTRAKMTKHKLTEHKSLLKKRPDRSIKQMTKIECPICFEIIRNEERLKNHLARHEKSTVKELSSLYCEVCGKHFFKKVSLGLHMNEVHENLYTCSVCDAKLETGKLLRDHLTSHENDDKFFHCQICFRGFTTHQYHNIHRKLAHLNNLMFLCDHESCNANFDTIPELNDHLKTHIGGAEDQNGNLNIKFCKTETCGMGFLNEYSLTLHELLHTPQSEAGNGGYDCPICGKNVRYVETLITHYNLQHGQKVKPYKCERCLKDFSNPIWFKTHVRLHEEQESGNPFICDICGVHCIDSVGLSAHRRGHDPTKIGRNAGVLLDSCAGPPRRYLCRMNRLDRRLDPASPPPPGSEKKSTKRRGRRPAPLPEQDQEKERELARQWTNIPCEVGTCKEVLETPYLFRKHLENVHEVDQAEKNIPCLYCHKKFAYRLTHEMHLRAEHKTKVYARFDCDEETCDVNPFQTLEQLNEHLSMEHVNLEAGRNVYFCGTCNWGFLASEQRDLHELVHLEPKDNVYTCPLCPQTHERIKLIQHHFNKIHGKDLKPLACKECGKGFFSKTALKFHEKVHRRRKEQDSSYKSLVCIECGVECKDQWLFEKHKREHNPENFVPCKEPSCPERFRNRKILWRHMKQAHAKGPQWVCDLCGRNFIYRFYLAQHMKTHMEGQFTCEICGIKCKRKDTLKLHKRNKHDANRDKKHVCSLCGKGFHSDAGLKYHFESTHVPETEWKLKCPKCPKKFYRKMLLGMHLKSCKGMNSDENVIAAVGEGKIDLKKHRKTSSNQKKKQDVDEGEMSDKSTTDDENTDIEKEMESNKCTENTEFSAFRPDDSHNHLQYPQQSCQESFGFPPLQYNLQLNHFQENKQQQS